MLMKFIYQDIEETVNFKSEEIQLSFIKSKVKELFITLESNEFLLFYQENDHLISMASQEDLSFLPTSNNHPVSVIIISDLGHFLKFDHSESFSFCAQTLLTDFFERNNSFYSFFE